MNEGNDKVKEAMSKATKPQGSGGQELTVSQKVKQTGSLVGLTQGYCYLSLRYERPHSGCSSEASNG